MRLVAGAFCLSVMLLAASACGTGHGGAKSVVEAGTASIAASGPSVSAVIPHAGQAAMAHKIEHLVSIRPDGVSGIPVNGALSSNGSLLAVGYSGDQVVAWDVDQTRSPVLVVRNVVEVLSSTLAVSGNGDLLAMAYLDTLSALYRVSVWNVPQRKLIADFTATDATVLRFSTDGTRLIVAGADLGIFNIATKQFVSSSLPACAGTGSPVTAAGSGPDGLSVVAVLDYGFFVWAPGKAACHLVRTDELDGYAVSPDGTEIAASTGDEVSVWDVRTGQEAAVLHVPYSMSMIYSAAFLGDSQLAVGGRVPEAGSSIGNRAVEVFNILSQRLTGQYDGGSDGIISGIFYSRGGLILAVSRGAGEYPFDVFVSPGTS